jgi:hypothetical protein
MKLRALLFCGMVATFAFAATAAARSQQETIQIDDTFFDQIASAVCGFEVTIHVEATVRVTLILDQEGNVVREIDRLGGGTVTISSPTDSISSPTAQPLIFDFGEGAEVGSEVTVKLVGLVGHVQGFIPSSAGLVVVRGGVQGFDQFGIPIILFHELVVQHGNFESQERILGAICAALS